MVKLSVAIMAHPARAEFVAELLEQLDRPYHGDIPVAWDEKSDRWDTGSRAWRMAQPDATHHFVIQDDAIVCKDLIAGLSNALERVPHEALVSPFMGQRRPASAKMQRLTNIARRQRASWIVLGPLNWGISILTPTDYIEEMIWWGGRQSYPNYDKRLGQFYRRVKPWPTWYTWPNLVEHRDTPSLIGHGPGRNAWNFIGTEASALDLGWDGGVVNVGGVMNMSRLTDRLMAQANRVTPSMANPGRTVNDQEKYQEWLKRREQRRQRTRRELDIDEHLGSR